MSLITQCPACSTMFRVVPDQLRISEGWVRCGKCDEVFDANAHLRSLEEVVHTPQPGAASPEREIHHEQEPAQDPYEATAMQPLQAQAEPAYDWGPMLAQPEQAVTLQEELPQQLPEPSPEPAPLDAPEPWAFVQQTDTLLEQGPPDMQLGQVAVDVPSPPQPEDDWAPTLHADLSSGVAVADAQVSQRLEAMAEDPPPSFLSQRPAQQSRWLGAKAMWAICSLLVVLLLGQVLLQERDRIAAASPALAPLLVAGCEVLACTVSPPRDIESIAIDSTALTSVRAGVYLLHVNLKNAAAIALATPALELTLTDTQDRPLLRRVLLPAELSGQGAMAAGAELGTSVPINVKLGATPEKIAGYKLLAFYP